MTYRDVAGPNELVGVTTRSDRKVYHRLDHNHNVICDRVRDDITPRTNRRKDIQRHYRCCKFCHPHLRTLVDAKKQPDHELVNKLMDDNMTTLPGLGD
jgi:hypothetical protein